MKRSLLLFRHAKSNWDEPGLADFDRPLAKRGRRAAERMGREMAARQWQPDVALVSSALRTRQTWERAAKELPRPVETRFVDAIYAAEPQDILAEIRKAPPACATLIVVGHNPGLEHIATLIASPDSDADALARIAEKFPTGSLARFELDGAWEKLDRARLTDFVRPRDLD